MQDLSLRWDAVLWSNSWQITSFTSLPFSSLSLLFSSHKTHQPWHKWWWISHNLIVSQKLKASTSKKQPLYRAAQGNVQIVDYSLIYCSIDFPMQSDPLWNSGFIHCLGVCTTGKWFWFICLFHQKRWDSGFTVRRQTVTILRLVGPLFLFSLMPSFLINPSWSLSFWFPPPYLSIALICWCTPFPPTCTIISPSPSFPFWFPGSM